MSLYGSLYSSVSGLKAQSNKIGVISDNISNVNTVGFKGGLGTFETLVANSGTIAYSPGGVLGSNRQQVSRQGLLLTTDTPTDIALSGDGFFVVKNENSADSENLFTRAGSFRQDSLGNFRNAAGFYLQAWPLDREGRLPGESGNVTYPISSANLQSLETVNIQSLTGAAAATTQIELGLNLKSSQTVYPGQAGIVDMDVLNTQNFGINSKEIITPGGVNSLARGDRFIVTTGAGLSYTYRYGGFTYSRNVQAGSNGDSGLSQLPSSVSLAANPLSTTNGSTTVTVTQPNHGLVAGNVITLNGVSSAVAGIPATDLNQRFVISNVTQNTYDITVATAATSTVSAGGGSGLSALIRRFSGNVLDATNANQTFLGTTGTTNFTTDSLKFTITNASGTKTFTYSTTTPNTQIGQFNSLNTLAAAISATADLTARVVNNRLYVGAIDANDSLTFANGNIAGDSGPPVKDGINWVRELGFADIALGENRFSTMQGLAKLVNASPGLDATISNPLSNSSLSINVEDPLDTITFADPAVGGTVGPFTSATPFSTINGSRSVTITHPSPHGLISGDIVTVDPTAFSDYPAPFSATNAFATTNGSATVTITQTGHGFTTGDLVYIDASTLTGYPTGNINGIPMTAFDGAFTVTVLTANTYTITAATPATSTGSTGAGTMLVSPTLNGIPMTEFNGAFTVNVTGPTTYTITLPTAANNSGPTGRTGLNVTLPNNSGSVVAELGLVDSLNNAVYTPQTTGALGPVYDPTDVNKNMAGGEITPQYTTNIRVYDSLGSGHDVRVSFIKTAQNTWAAEVSVIPADDVTGTSSGQLAYGNVVFNGDGSLRSVDATLANPLSAIWANGASESSITIDWGTAGPPFGTAGATTFGKADGVSQFDSAYRLNFSQQNGVPVGELIGVNITEEGFVVANYNNGETQKLYKIPVSSFSNPDQLGTVTGNVYQQSAESGVVNLRSAGEAGTGKIQSSALESSNVELSEQLTDMIVAQRAYQANTRIITTTDQLLQELSRIGQ